MDLLHGPPCTVIACMLYGNIMHHNGYCSLVPIKSQLRVSTDKLCKTRASSCICVSVSHTTCKMMQSVVYCQSPTHNMSSLANTKHALQVWGSVCQISEVAKNIQHYRIHILGLLAASFLGEAFCLPCCRPSFFSRPGSCCCCCTDFVATSCFWLGKPCRCEPE